MILSPHKMMPTYHGGYARCAADSAAPGMWRGCVGAWYPTLGPTGVTLRDVSGRHNDGTLRYMDPATDWVQTPYGWATELDGFNDYIEVAAPTWDISNAGTVVLAFRYNGLSTGRYPYCISQTNSAGTRSSWGLGTQRAVGAIRAVGANAAGVALWDFLGSAIVQAWRVYAMTWDGATARLYEDGAEVNSAGYVGVLDGGGQALSFGRLVVYKRYMGGCYAYCDIYDRALSPAEIAELYADPFAMIRRRPAMVSYYVPTVGGGPIVGSRIVSSSIIGPNILRGVA